MWPWFSFNTRESSKSSAQLLHGPVLVTHRNSYKSSYLAQDSNNVKVCCDLTTALGSLYLPRPGGGTNETHSRQRRFATDRAAWDDLTLYSSPVVTSLVCRTDVLCCRPTAAWNRSAGLAAGTGSWSVGGTGGSVGLLVGQAAQLAG